jgi:hypothetical protein
MEELTEVVARFRTRYEAELAQGYLENAGIESALVTDDAGGAMVGMGFAGPRLLVRIEDVPKARAALEEAGVLEDEEASE